MWQYSTETIINSNEGKLMGKKRFGVYNVNTSDTDLAPNVAAGDTFIIDGVNAFKPENITAIYKTGGRPAAAEEIKLEFKLADASAQYSDLEGKVIRLLVVIREEGRVSSPMQNAYLRHMKPFFYEIISTGVEANDVNAMVKLISKDMADTDFHYFHAESNAKKIKLIGDDAHIRFVGAELAQVPQEDMCACPHFEDLGAKLLGWKDYVLMNKDFEVVVAGDLGAGTVEHLIKDLRIPTNASINPFGADHGGMPIPGMIYDQYLIEYTTDRRHIGHQVMGSANDKSITSHVFFLPREVGAAAAFTGVSKEFSDILDAIATLNGFTVEEAGAVVRTNVSQNSTSGKLQLDKKTPENIGSVE